MDRESRVNDCLLSFFTSYHSDSDATIIIIYLEINGWRMRKCSSSRQIRAPSNLVAMDSENAFDDRQGDKTVLQWIRMRLHKVGIKYIHQKVVIDLEVQTSPGVRWCCCCSGVSSDGLVLARQPTSVHWRPMDVDHVKDLHSSSLYCVKVETEMLPTYVRLLFAS